MKILVTIIVVIAAFEVIEHIIVPLVWAAFARKKPSVSGATGLLKQLVEVKSWQGKEGYVLVRGELWKAVCDDPLSAGEKAVVRSVDGLTLRVVRAGGDRTQEPRDVPTPPET